MIMNDNLLVSPLLSSASSPLEVLEKTIISEQVCKGLPTVLWMWIPLPFYEVLDPSVPFSLLHNPFWLVNVFALRQVSWTTDTGSSSFLLNFNETKFWCDYFFLWYSGFLLRTISRSFSEAFCLYLGWSASTSFNRELVRKYVILLFEAYVFAAWALSARNNTPSRSCGVDSF